MNLVCVTKYGDWIQEPLTDKAEASDVLAHRKSWHPTVRSVIRALPETFIWALHDRTVLECRLSYTSGRCLPMMAQGAAPLGGWYRSSLESAPASPAGQNRGRKEGLRGVLGVTRRFP